MSFKMLLTLVIICKLCHATPPLAFMFEPIGEISEIHAAADHATPAGNPQPGGLRRLFGRRLLGQ
jgi:hypothetical protein